jgi:uncharacterized protein YukE
MSTDPARGDVAGIRRAAHTMAVRADAVQLGGRAVRTAATAARHGWTGQAQRAFVEAADGVPESAARIVDRLQNASDALHAYAVEIGHIQDDARRLAAARANVAADLTANERALAETRRLAALPDATESDATRLRRLAAADENLRGSRARVDREWDDLIARRARADHRAVAALSSPAVVGVRLASSTIARLSDEGFLAYLAGLDREQIRLLDPDGAAAKRLATIADAAAVARWWQSLRGPDGRRSAVQTALIMTLPGVIGNLEGVAYAARDAANRVALPRLLAEAQRATEDWTRRAGAATTEGARHAALERLAEWQKRLDGYTAIAQAIRRQGFALLSLVPDVPPLAQLAYGNVDRAKHVTYVVPGMNTATSVPDTVQQYSNAIRLFSRRQWNVANVDASEVATIAWIGYHPPMQDASAPSVIGMGAANTGADRLVATIDGFHATRAASGRTADVSVVAHSYGTTTASVALTRVHVDHAVLLGSAGVDRAHVPTAVAMQVPAGEVYASQGEHDLWAITGQALSFRADPTGSAFGAHTFSSEAATINGTALYGVDRHGPFGDGESIHSYFDDRTTAQYRTAQATMGLGSEIPTEGTPEDRGEVSLSDGIGPVRR